MPVDVSGMDSIYHSLEEIPAAVVESLVRKLQYIGEASVNEARKSGSYTDRSGHLRQSIGYAILVDGEVEVIAVTPGETSAESSEYISELCALYPTGIVLIVVAGKDYAAYVQALGYDVLLSADLLLDREKEGIVEFLQKAIDKKISK